MNLIQRIFNISNRSRKAYPAPETQGPEYYLLECWNQYPDLLPQLLPYIDCVKAKEEWEKAGFTLEYNRYGHIRKVRFGHKYYSFIKVDPEGEREKEALRTSKRLTYHPEHIELLIMQGCRPEEFL